MADRIAIRTMPLKEKLYEANRELEDLEFFEPQSILFDELEKAVEWNSHCKKRKNIVATGGVLLSHLTGLHVSTLAKMSFGDRKTANEIAAEIMDAELGEGEDSEGEN